MNEESQKILAEILKKASEGIDSAVAFSQAQIPDVVHQLLVWNFVSTILAQFICICFAVVCALALRWALNQRKIGANWTNFKSSFEEARVSYLTSTSYDVLVTLLPIGFLVFSVSSLFLFGWLKIWLAPKLYLIEYAASLVK